MSGAKFIPTEGTVNDFHRDPGFADALASGARMRGLALAAQRRLRDARRSLADGAEEVIEHRVACRHEDRGVELAVAADANNDAFPRPEYPFASRTLPAGTCVRGWITFSAEGGPDGTVVQAQVLMQLDEGADRIDIGGSIYLAIATADTTAPWSRSSISVRARHRTKSAHLRPRTAKS